jgi:hypothetical protein
VADKTYSINEEQYYDLSDVLDMLQDDDRLVPGTIIYEGEQVQRSASDYLHSPADTIMEQLADAAWDEAGEFAEGWPELPADKKQELGDLIGKWLDANLPVHFWTVRNVRKLELTAEWIAENTATIPAGVAPVEAPRCPHGIRHPHPCRECEDAPPPAGVRPVQASSRTAIDEIFDEAVSAAATANAGRPKEVSWVQAASDLANDSGVDVPRADQSKGGA